MTDWTWIDFGDEPKKVPPPPLTKYQAMQYEPAPEKAPEMTHEIGPKPRKRGGWPKGKPRKQPE